MIIAISALKLHGVVVELEALIIVRGAEVDREGERLEGVVAVLFVCKLLTPSNRLPNMLLSTDFS